jgi:hypothetical protein
VGEIRDIPIEEEFREAEREIAIEEIRMYRNKSIDEILTGYFAYLRSANQWCEAFRREPRSERLERLVREQDDRERDAYLDRLDWLCNGA